MHGAVVKNNSSPEWSEDLRRRFPCETLLPTQQVQHDG